MNGANLEIRSNMLDETAFIERMLNTKVVALYFWGRSGSFFLQSLLDFHPEIITLPTGAMTAYHTDQWHKLLARINGAQDITLEELFDYFIELNPAAFDYPAFNISVDHEEFREWMRALTEIFIRVAGLEQLNRKTFFLLANYAYALATGREVDRVTTILYHTHDPSYFDAARNALQDFPDFRAIGMIREPARALNSNMHYWESESQKLLPNYNPVNHELVDLVYNGYYGHCYRHQLLGWTKIKQELKIPFYAVRQEALHLNPRQELEALARWLGIGWDDSLLESTFNGKPYRWQSPVEKKTITGFDPNLATSREWQKNLSSLDRLVLHQLVKLTSDDYAYLEVPKAIRLLLPLLILWPTKLELRALRYARKRDRYKYRSALLSVLHRYYFSYRYLFDRTIREGAESFA